MKKTKRILALLTAAVLVFAAAGCAFAGDDEYDPYAYWEESGRAYLDDILHNVKGRVLSEAERAAFFTTYGVMMANVLDAGTGYFVINGDGSFSGRFAETDGTETWSTDFYGKWTDVTQLSMYTYALESDQITKTKEDFPEVIQGTMLFTIPGARSDAAGVLIYEIQRINQACGQNPEDPLPCAFITAFDNAPVWYSEPAGGTTPVTPVPVDPSGQVDEDIYGLTIQKLATRTGPGTQYDGGGTYSVKDQYIKVLTRAWDKRNKIWWVKCEIPYRNEIRVLWTGYKRFDPDSLPLECIPIDPEYAD